MRAYLYPGLMLSGVPRRHHLRLRRVAAIIPLVHTNRHLLLENNTFHTCPLQAIMTPALDRRVADLDNRQTASENRLLAIENRLSLFENRLSSHTRLVATLLGENVGFGVRLDDLTSIVGR